MLIQIDTVQHNPGFTQTNRECQRMLPVGMIEIRAYRTTYGKPGGPTKWASRNGWLKRKGETVTEKALKGDAKSHGTA